MPDADFGTQIAQLIAAGYSQQQAQALLQSAYAQAQANLADVKGQYQNLATPNYKTITPDKLGPSQLGNIQNDPQGRAAEQQAIASLKDIAARGGLNISDQAALNQIQENTNRNAVAREKSITDSAAARGQLGAGATLAAQLQGLQNSDQSANQAGEAAAGQAQNRAMAALTQKAGLGRQMSQDEYNKAADAAKANDLIANHNAQNSMQAQQENNQWLNTGFGNNLSKINGQAGLVTQQNGITEKSGIAAANNALGTGNLVQAGIGAAGKAFGGGSGSYDPSTNPNGPGGGAPGYQDPNVLNTTPQGPTTDPFQWNTFGSSSTGPTVEDYDPSKLTDLAD